VASDLEQLRSLYANWLTGGTESEADIHPYVTALETEVERLTAAHRENFTEAQLICSHYLMKPEPHDCGFRSVVENIRLRSSAALAAAEEGGDE
jgi:hypothetical protein